MFYTLVLNVVTTYTTEACYYLDFPHLLLYIIFFKLLTKESRRGVSTNPRLFDVQRLIRKSTLLSMLSLYSIQGDPSMRHPNQS